MKMGRLGLAGDRRRAARVRAGPEHTWPADPGASWRRSPVQWMVQATPLDHGVALERALMAVRSDRSARPRGLPRGAGSARAGRGCPPDREAAPVLSAAVVANSSGVSSSHRSRIEHLFG
jgi:hypothetical protein